MRRRSVAKAIALAFVTLSLGGGSAYAQTEDVQRRAATEFAEGQRAFTAGDYRHAAESFEAAYRDKPHYSPLWNAARSWERAGEAPRAANLYARYLREAPANAPDRDGATAALFALTPRLARLELHPAEGVTVLVDGAPAEDATMYVNPGDHVIEGKKGDRSSRKTQTVESTDVVSVAVDVEAPKAVAPATPAPATSAAHERAPTEEHHGLTPVVAIVGGVLTLGAAGFTVWSGVDTLHQKDSFDQSRTQANLDDGHAKQTRTNIGIVVTSVLGAATAVTAIFFTDWGSHEGRTARARPGSPRVGVGPGSVLVEGTF